MRMGTMGFEPKPDVLAHAVRCARLAGLESNEVRSARLTIVRRRSGHDGIRTHDRRIRSPTLYPD